ncbi:MAG TPA: electron transfer flavoprotein subunit alpha/FixB family protein [Spirochaetota bacterium]|nr:electron transfer flavoprotein subunit alpha/FixB family protein [Spirochaetota bacterium]HQO40179.1 electron transfer flavoprotein subunit alpha/FixB family protein [Spirochaetota bacterium]
MINRIMIMCEPRITQSQTETPDPGMVNFCRLVCGETPCVITAVHPCSSPSDATPIRGADMLVMIDSAFEHYSSSAWEKASLIAAEKINPDIIVIPHTAAGYDYAPRVAALMDASCISSVTAVENSDGRTLFRRSGFHGKLDMLYEAGKFPAVITVMPGAFTAEETGKHGSVEEIRCSISMESVSDITLTDTSESNPELENADVVIAAGRGIGRQENLELVRSMAALFPASSIAGSRILCDNGWIEYRYQVGLTGKKISPRLYVACGISGSPQHIAGMKDSGTVVAVNRDPGAAIFSHSDICIVEDLEKFIPAFLEAAAGHNQK